MNQNTLIDMYNQMPFEMKVLIASGVEMEYIFDYENNKCIAKTKNKVAVHFDEENGYTIVERIT